MEPFRLPLGNTIQRDGFGSWGKRLKKGPTDLNQKENHFEYDEGRVQAYSLPRPYEADRTIGGQSADVPKLGEQVLTGKTAGSLDQEKKGVGNIYNHGRGGGGKKSSWEQR